MIRYLAGLCLLSHLVLSQGKTMTIATGEIHGFALLPSNQGEQYETMGHGGVDNYESYHPDACSTCDRTKAALIGKLECASSGSLKAWCDKGPIRMKASGVWYNFDSVACLAGKWNGTTAQGQQIYLSTVLPSSTCPDVDYPEQTVQGSPCTIRAIGYSTVYNDFFASFPKLDSTGAFVCQAEEHWESFSQMEVRGEGLNHIFARDENSFAGYKKIPSKSLSCTLNAISGKHEFTYSGNSVGTNQIECLYKKCPPLHTFNKFKGRCEGSTPNSCGYALVYDPVTEEFASNHMLAMDGTTTIPSNITHLVVYPACKVSVFGSKPYESTTTKIPLVFEQSFGVRAIFSAMDEDISFAGFNVPTTVVTKKEYISPTAAALTDGTVVPFVISDENRYALIPITADSTFLILQLEEGGSFSMAGTGSGELIYNFIDESSDFGLQYEFKMQTKKFMYKILGSNAEEGERDLLIESDSIYVRFVYVRANTLALYVNGRFFYQIEKQGLRFNKMRIRQTNMQADKGRFYFPKVCGKYHIFSEKSGECEYDYKSSGYCARLTSTNGTDTWKTGWVKDGTMPHGYKGKTRFVEVREGCTVFAYNGEKQLMKLNGKNKCHHKRGRYNFPNLNDGTCSTPERGLQHIECYCEDDDERPRHDGTAPIEWNIDGDSIIYQATLIETRQWTIPINIFNWIHFIKVYIAQIDNALFSTKAEFNLVTGTGDAPLVIFFEEGKMTVDNRQGGVLKNQVIVANHTSITKKHRFECRIFYVEAGYEIRINGAKVLVYPYNQPKTGIIKGKALGGLKIRQHRTDKIVEEPLDFTDEPLITGDHVHFNGIASSSNFNLSLRGSEQEELYTLQFDLTQRKIIQTLVTRYGVKTKESTICSIFIGVEFDVVIKIKVHTIEVYINGEIIETIGETLPEKKFCSAHHHKEHVQMCGKRRGPKKHNHEPKWDKGDENSREESNEDSHEH